jgi:hypothetical protein
MDTNGSPRSRLLLGLGLVALALGFFVAGRGWWNGLFSVAGVVLLAAWMFGASQPWGLWMRERRWITDRRQRSVTVAAERRQIERRAAA